jgi:hypothetical protein
MTVVWVEPDATVANSGVAVTGAGGDADTATSDDTDATYLTFNSLADTISLGFGEPAIPAGAVIKQAALWIRTALNAGTSFPVDASLFFNSVYAGFGRVNVTWTTPTTHAIVAVAPSAVANPTATLDPPGDILDGTHELNVYELDLSVTYVAKPVVNVTDPTGTFTDSNTPAVEWENTFDADGGAQVGAAVAIYSSAQYSAPGFDPSTATAYEASGALSGTQTSWTPTVPQANGTYRAYVRTWQVVNGSIHLSDWDFSQYTINVTAPTSSDFDVSADVANARVVIDLNTSAGADLAIFRRSTDGGETWDYVRSSGAPAMSDALAALISDDFDGFVFPVENDAVWAYDYEAPLGVTITYQVLIGLLVTGSGWVWSTWTAADATVELDTQQWWLKHPTEPDLNAEVTLNSLPSAYREARQGRQRALSGSSMVVVSDGYDAPSGEVTFLLEEQEEQEAIDALIEADVPLLLQGPPENFWPDRWVRLGSQTRARAADRGWIEPVLDTYPWVEVPRPDGAIDFPGGS